MKVNDSRLTSVYNNIRKYFDDFEAPIFFNLTKNFTFYLLFQQHFNDFSLTHVT